MTARFPPLVALVGPTGVGKTELAIELARALDGEIVNADSRQVYRYMQIGTAKPTLAEQAAVPHHLYDLIDPDAPFSLAAYQELARQTIEAITARGRVPLLVGGTGQYVAAVIEGWNIPRVPPHPEIRAELERAAGEHGTAALHERLRAVDPIAAATIEPNNVRRIVRALEVYRVTGRPISVQQTRQPPPYRVTTLWLGLDRAQLYPRLDRRVDGMIAAGLGQEVAALLERGYGWELPAMSSLGYKEFAPHFSEGAPLGACIERLKFNTHHFVRKQEMWFRRLPHTTRLDAAAPDVLARAINTIEAR